MTASAGTDAEVAVAAALAGAAVVRAMFGSELVRFDKSGGDFATAADLEAEMAIIGIIRTARPADAIMGEESGSAGADGAERRWLVDPLCGTLNYAARSMLAAVNVALQAGPGITAAASADPFSGEVFWTDGDRACLRSDGADAGLAPSPGTRLVDVNLDPPFPNAPGVEDSLVFEQIHEQVYRDLGFEVVDVPAGPLGDRVGLILRAIRHSPG